MVIRERIVEEESQRLEQWLDFIRQRGVPAGGKMLYGTAFLEIIREVLRNGHDLVMTAAEGRAALKDRLFGSTAMHLMRKCPCPVWVVKPTQPETHTRILAAVDPYPADEEQARPQYQDHGPGDSAGPPAAVRTARRPHLDLSR